MGFIEQILLFIFTLLAVLTMSLKSSFAGPAILPHMENSAISKFNCQLF